MSAALRGGVPAPCRKEMGLGGWTEVQNDTREGREGPPAGAQGMAKPGRRAGKKNQPCSSLCSS